MEIMAGHLKHLVAILKCSVKCKVQNKHCIKEGSQKFVKTVKDKQTQYCQLQNKKSIICL